MTCLRWLIWIAVGLVTPLQAQQSLKASFPRMALRQGTTALTIRQLVKMYPEPNRQSMALGVLVRGEEVQILEKVALVESFDGLHYPWYKVRVGANTGFVFGAHLSVLSFTGSKGIRYSLHLVGMDHANPEEINIEINAIQRPGEAPLSTLSTRLALHPDDTLIVQTYDQRGLSSSEIEQVVILEQWNVQCPGHHRETAFLRKGIGLTMLPGPSADKAGCTTISYSFPADPGGKPGLIQVKRQVGAAAVDWLVLYEKFPGVFLPKE